MRDLLDQQVDAEELFTEAEDDVEFEQQGGAYPLTGVPY